jgi:hypothetical protein
MSKKIMPVLAMMLVAFCLPPAAVAAAQEAKAKEPAAAQEQKASAFYRVEYTISEFAGDKRLNSRSYKITAAENDWAYIRAGSRVPYGSVQNGTLQYQDIGMKIDCRPQLQDGVLRLYTSVESSSLASSDEGGIQPTSSNPVFRRVTASMWSPVVPGKPTLIGSLDDVVTNHRYDIEVTVTRVK